jgi:hypothetical protein
VTSQPGSTFSFSTQPATTTVGTGLFGGSSIFKPATTTTTPQAGLSLFGAGGTTGTSLLGTTGTLQTGGLFGNTAAQSVAQGPALTANIDSNAYGTNPLLQPKGTDAIQAASIGKPVAGAPGSAKKALGIPQYRFFPTPKREVRLKQRLLSTTPSGKTPSHDRTLTPVAATSGIPDSVVFSAEQFQTRKSVKKLNITERAESRPSASLSSSLGSAPPAARPSLSRLDSTAERKKVSWNLPRTSGDSFSLGGDSILEPPTPVRKLDFTATSPDTPRTLDIKPTQERTASPASFDLSLSAMPSEYSMSPSLPELLIMSEAQLKNIRNLEIEHKEFGSLHWLVPVDLSVFLTDDRPFRGLDSIAGNVVKFAKKMCIVYEDTDSKHARGEGLNKPAEITLYKCWPIDRSSRAPIVDPSNPRVQQQIEKLKAIPETEFKSFDTESGNWVFVVQHFSRYGLADEDDEDVQPASETQKSIETQREMETPVPVVPESTHTSFTFEQPSTTTVRDHRRIHSMRSSLFKRQEKRRSSRHGIQVSKRAEPVEVDYEKLKSVLREPTSKPISEEVNLIPSVLEPSKDALYPLIPTSPPKKPKVEEPKQVTPPAAPPLTTEKIQDLEYIIHQARKFPIVQQGSRPIDSALQPPKVKPSTEYPKMGQRVGWAWQMSSSGQSSMVLTRISQSGGKHCISLETVEIGVVRHNVKDENELTVPNHYCGPAHILGEARVFKNLRKKSGFAFGSYHHCCRRKPTCGIIHEANQV